MASKQTTAEITIKAQDRVSAVLDRINTKVGSMAPGFMALKGRVASAMPTAEVQRFGSSVARLNGQLATVGIGVAGIGLGIAGMASAAFDAVTGVAEKADRIGDLGGRLRLGAEEFQVFEKLAQDAGASIEEIGGAFTKFRTNLQVAQSEGGAKLDALNQQLASFGVTAEQARNLKPLELMKLMGQVSAASTGDDDEELKLQRFKELFGKAGATLIPVIESIGTEYDATAQKMREAGVLMSDDMVEQGGRAAKSWERAQNAFGALKTAFGIQMMPAFDKFANALDQRLKANRKSLMPGMEDLAKNLTSQVGPIVDGLEKIIGAIGMVFKMLSAVASVIGWDKLVFGGVLLIAAPFIAAFGSMALAVGGLAWSITALIAKFALAPILTAVKGLVVTLQLLGYTGAQAWVMVLGPISLVLAGIALLVVNLKNIGNYFTGVIDRIKAATAAAGLFGGIWQMVKELAMAPLNAIIGTINTVLDGLKAIGIGSGGNISLVGGAMNEPQTRVAQAAWGNEGRRGAGATVPATSPAVARSEVGGRMVVEVRDGRTDIKSVESSNKNFNIDAMSGGMFAGA